MRMTKIEFSNAKASELVIASRNDPIPTRRQQPKQV